MFDTAVHIATLFGADDGTRTRKISLENWGVAITLHLHRTVSQLYTAVTPIPPFDIVGLFLSSDRVDRLSDQPYT